MVFCLLMLSGLTSKLRAQASANIYHTWQRIVNVGTVNWPPPGCMNIYFSSSAVQTCGCCGGGGTQGVVASDITAQTGFPSGGIPPGGSFDWYSPSYEMVAYGCSGSSGTLTVIICGVSVGSSVFNYDSGDYTDQQYPSTTPFICYVNACTATNTADCTTNLTFTASNGNSVWAIFAVQTPDGETIGAQQVQPGGVYQYNIPGVDCDKASQYQLVSGTSDDNVKPVALPPSGTPGTTGGSTNANFSPTSGQFDTNAFPDPVVQGTNVTLPPPSIYNPTNFQNIMWSSAASTNAAAATQQGSSALYDAITKGFNQNHDDLTSLKNSGSTVSAGTNLNLSLTNYNLETTQVGISNLIAQIANRTNAAPGSNSIELSGLTNFNTMAANATNAFAGTINAFGNMESDVSGVDNGVPSGTAPVFDIATFTMGGSSVDWSINLDNDTWHPLWVTMNRLWTMIITFGYASFVILTLYSQMKIWTAAQGGGVPSVQLELFGTGGNALGVIVFILLVVFMLGVLAAGELGVISSLTGAVNWHTMFTNVGTSSHVFELVDGRAMYLLNECFPVSFAISALIAGTTWRLVVLAVTTGIVAIMRALPTR